MKLPSAPARITAAPAVPCPSEQLLDAMRQIGCFDSCAIEGPPYDGEHWFLAIMPPAPVLAEARAIGAALGRTLAPAGPAVLREWLRPLVAAVRNPPAEGEFATRLAALSLICANHPLCCFTPTSQREALTRFSFWPSAAAREEFEASRKAPLGWPDEAKVTPNERWFLICTR